MIFLILEINSLCFWSLLMCFCDTCGTVHVWCHYGKETKKEKNHWEWKYVVINISRGRGWMKYVVFIKLILAGLFTDLIIISNKTLIFLWCSLLPYLYYYLKMDDYVCRVTGSYALFLSPGNNTFLHYLNSFRLWTDCYGLWLLKEDGMLR